MASLKRGGSFSKRYQLRNSSVLDWSEWEGRAQLRAFFEDGELLAEFEFNWIDPANGIFSIEYHETDDWPTGKHFFDVRFTNGRFNFITSTKTVDVAASVTKNE